MGHSTAVVTHRLSFLFQTGETNRQSRVRSVTPEDNFFVMKKPLPGRTPSSHYRRGRDQDAMMQSTKKPCDMSAIVE